MNALREIDRAKRAAANRIMRRRSEVRAHAVSGLDSRRYKPTVRARQMNPLDPLYLGDKYREEQTRYGSKVRGRRFRGVTRLDSVRKRL